jgi:hypothetical protein
MAAPNIEGTANPSQVLPGGGNGGTPTLLTAYLDANAPAYFKGGIYFSLTSNKLKIGGATAWETVTSA